MTQKNRETEVEVREGRWRQRDRSGTQKGVNQRPEERDAEPLAREPNCRRQVWEKEDGEGKR